MKSFPATLAATAVVVLAPSLALAQAQPAAPRAPAPAPAAAPAAPAQPASSGAGISHPEEQAAARLAAAGWLTLLDRRDWGRAWESSARMFRDTVPLDAWMESIPKVRGPLGTLQDREPVESNFRTSLPGRPAGEYVSVIFRSRFSGKEVAEIVTTVHEPDGHWRVTGYSPR